VRSAWLWILLSPIRSSTAPSLARYISARFRGRTPKIAGLGLAQARQHQCLGATRRAAHKAGRPRLDFGLGTSQNVESVEVLCAGRRARPIGTRGWSPIVNIGFARGRSRWRSRKESVTAFGVARVLFLARPARPAVGT
jgi:hypothetical protein